jgi:hypothetical protein
MVCIDFYGYRLSAQALLPIKDGALVYGSSDGGHVIHDAAGHDALLASLEDVLEHSLRLAKHTVLDGRGTARQFAGPVDMEIHHGTDGAYYLLDAARLMPPVRPHPNRVNAIFFELFRPEFLLWNNEPLSSDAYSRFGRGDAHALEAVNRATLRLLKERIPELARSLTPNACAAAVVSQTFHSYGVNMRYLGAVRGLVSEAEAEVRQLLLDEMLIRVLKHWLLDELRSLVEQLCSPTLTPLLTRMRDMFQRLVSDGKLWCGDGNGSVKERLLRKFGLSALTADEMRPGCSLKFLFPRVLVMLCQRSGVRLSEDMIHRVLKAPALDDVKFLISDFTLKPVLKELDVTLGALEESLRRDAKFKVGQQKMSLLSQALMISKSRVIAEPKSLRMHVSLLRALCVMTKEHLTDNAAARQWLAQTDLALQRMVALAREKKIEFVELYYLSSKVRRFSYLVEAGDCAQQPALEHLLKHWILAWQAAQQARSYQRAITQWNLNQERVLALQRRVGRDLWDFIFRHLRSATDYALFVNELQPVASRCFVESTLLHADRSTLHFFPIYMGLAQHTLEVLLALTEWLHGQSVELIELRDWTCDWLSDDTCCALLNFLCGKRHLPRWSLGDCTLITVRSIGELTSLAGR